MHEHRPRLTTVAAVTAALVGGACTSSATGRVAGGVRNPASSSSVPTSTGDDGARARSLASSLIDAAERGDATAARELLAAGADVTATESDGATALVRAAYGNHVDVAELLIGAGADVNHKDDTEQSAYLIATSDGFVELLDLTLAHGADVRSLDSYRGTGLIRAADRGHVAIVEHLLRTDINVDHVNRLGWTALLEAIILGSGDERHTAVVGLLVGHHADVNLADRDGTTPLAHATHKHQQAIIDILIAAGAKT